MPNLQIFQRGPTKSSQTSQQLMQAMGQLGQAFQGIQQKQQQKGQQGNLAAALFPDDPEKQKLFATLPADQQIAAQKNMIAQQKQQQGNQLFERVFGTTLGAEQNQIDPMQNEQQNATPQPPPQPQSNPRDPSTWSEEQLVKLSAFAGQPGDAGILGNMGKNELERRNKEEKKKDTTFLKDRDYHGKKTEDIEAKASSLRDSLPKQEMALNMAADAIKSKEVGAFSLANLAERSGIKELQTAKGAQLVTASKEYLLGNISKVGAKGLNQWFEQRMNSMFPMMGQSEEANETIETMLRGELDMNKAWLDEYEKLSKEDKEKYGFKKEDIDQRVAEAVKPKNEEIFNKTNYKTREIYEKEKGFDWLKSNAYKPVPKGTPLTMSMAKAILLRTKNDKDDMIKKAKELGYTIPDYRKILE